MGSDARKSVLKIFEMLMSCERSERVVEDMSSWISL